MWDMGWYLETHHGQGEDPASIPQKSRGQGRCLGLMGWLCPCMVSFLPCGDFKFSMGKVVRVNKLCKNVCGIEMESGYILRL